MTMIDTPGVLLKNKRNRINNAACAAYVQSPEGSYLTMFHHVQDDKWFITMISPRTS